MPVKDLMNQLNKEPSAESPKVDFLPEDSIYQDAREQAKQDGEKQRAQDENLMSIIEMIIRLLLGFGKEPTPEEDLENYIGPPPIQIGVSKTDYNTLDPTQQEKLQGILANVNNEFNEFKANLEKEGVNTEKYSTEMQNGSIKISIPDAQHRSEFTEQIAGKLDKMAVNQGFDSPLKTANQSAAVTNNDTGPTTSETASVSKSSSPFQTPRCTPGGRS
jgi:hypothetical protein